ncbi:MAG: hypothetical protein H0T62_03730 [Parachlamydiaceae bacterium]|nr:hypothetical protein [Parachlamydiaceae bacterium]
MINPNNDSGYKDLWHKEIGKVEFATKDLTLKEAVNYKKSEILGRTWKSLELGYARKGMIDNDTVNSALRQIPNKETFISQLGSARHKLMGQAVGEAIKNDPSVKRHISSILRTSSVESAQKNKNLVLDALSKAIGMEVEHSLNEGNEWNKKQCLANLNTLLNFPSGLVDYEPGGGEVFDALVRMDMKVFAPIVEGKLDLLLSVDSYLARDLSERNQITGTTEKIAKQIDNLTEAIYFLNMSNK